MSNKAKIAIILIVIALFWGFGFWLGRKHAKIITKIKIEYIANPKITGVIVKPQPIREIKPIDTLRIVEECIAKGIYSEVFPKREFIKYVPDKSDSTAIMKDWATIREYQDTLYNNDTTGTFVLSSKVRYNRIERYAYEYTTVTKIVTNTERVVKGFSPFVGVGYISDGFGVVNGGFYIKEKYGFSGVYERDFINGKNHYGGMISIKF